MTRALLLRHGESISNADSAAAALPEEQGDRLSPRGREQAAAAAEALRDSGATQLLTSPLRRARETAEAIAKAIGLPIEVLPYAHELRESRRYGELRPEEQKLRRWSSWMSEHADEPDYSYEGAESFNDVVARVRRLKAELERRSDSGRPIVVTHGIFKRFFLFDTLLGDAFGVHHVPRLWYLRSLNCGLSEFEHGERWHAADAETPGWTCITWMQRSWDPPR